MTSGLRTSAGTTTTVRMYAVGFGDCLLVTVTGGARPWRMLVDCGVHSHGVGPHALRDVVDDVLTTAQDDGGPPRLDVVAATHRHRDHIIGFDDDRWSSVEVGEVWLPWTEDPEDVSARAMRQGLDDVARGLAMTFAADDEPLAAFALNSLTNDEAMATLLTGFTGGPRRRFLRADPAPVALPGLRHGRAHVLGPPADADTLRRMDPPAAERWVAGDRDVAPPVRPFPDTLALTAEAYARRYPRLALAEKVRRRTVLSGAPPLAAAAWVDRCVNNTSLLLALEVGDVVLVLAGDAQWGPWQAALDDPRARDLLRRASLYKVSHHGSHNGTPRTLAEEVLGEEVVSLVSVRPVSNWKDIPKQGLVDELSTGSRRVLRSDADTVPEGVRRHPDGLWIEVVLPPGQSVPRRGRG